MIQPIPLHFKDEEAGFWKHCFQYDERLSAQRTDRDTGRYAFG